jgi:hypothetical protein
MAEMNEGFAFADGGRAFSHEMEPLRPARSGTPNVAADLLRLSVAVRAWDTRQPAHAADDVAALVPHVETFCRIAGAGQMHPALARRLVRSAVCLGMPAGAARARRDGVVQRIQEAMDGLS